MKSMLTHRNPSLYQHWTSGAMPSEGLPWAGRGIIPLDCCATTCSLCLWLNSRPIKKYLKNTCSSVFSLKQERAKPHPFNTTSHFYKVTCNTCWGRQPTEQITPKEVTWPKDSPDSTIPFTAERKLLVTSLFVCFLGGRCQLTNISNSLQALNGETQHSILSTLPLSN